MKKLVDDVVPRAVLAYGYCSTLFATKPLRYKTGPDHVGHIIFA